MSKTRIFGSEFSTWLQCNFHSFPLRCYSSLVFVGYFVCMWVYYKLPQIAVIFRSSAESVTTKADASSFSADGSHCPVDYLIYKRIAKIPSVQTDLYINSGESEAPPPLWWPVLWISKNSIHSIGVKRSEVMRHLITHSVNAFRNVKSFPVCWSFATIVISNNGGAHKTTTKNRKGISPEVRPNYTNLIKIIV